MTTATDRPPRQAVDVTRVMAQRDALDRVPGRHARRWGALPLTLTEDTLCVVLADGENDEAISRLERLTGLSVFALPARNAGDVAAAIRRYYPDEASENAGTPLGLLEELVDRALQVRCSDIHVDPERDGGHVRMRIDGLMRVERPLDSDTLSELVSAIKVAAGLDIAEKRIPQDGQVSVYSQGEEITMRVATAPTIRGEKVTLRILATAAIAAELADLDGLGMAARHREALLLALDQPNGILLLSGPTGSGKTTTLYAALRYLKEPGTRHILSIEDPVEIPLDGINQVHVDADRVSFAGALRSALRHDPDVIMVGEIRDEETADIAVKSALTGHLVLSTVHANNAAAVVTRLLNLGVTPDLLTSALRLVMAQRLVRRPCVHCGAWTDADPANLHALGWDGAGAPRVIAPVGCALCANTGYAGRIGLYELAPVTGAVRELVHAGAGEAALARELFERQGWPSLARDGLAKALEGLTTLEEVRRVALLGE